MKWTTTFDVHWLFSILWHFSVADSRRRMLPLNVDLSETVVIVVEVEPDSTSITVAYWSPIELQQLRLAFPLGRNSCKTWPPTIADWITTVTTVWNPGLRVWNGLKPMFPLWRKIPFKRKFQHWVGKRREMLFGRNSEGNSVKW